MNLGVWGDDSAARESPNSFYNQVQQQREVGSLQQFEPELSNEVYFLNHSFFLKKMFILIEFVFSIRSRILCKMIKLSS